MVDELSDQKLASSTETTLPIAVIGMVWFGLVWRSNQTKPAAYIITSLVLLVRPTKLPRMRLR